MTESGAGDLDPVLSVVCPHDPASRDYVVPALWNTHPGRLPMWCPSRGVSFRMSVHELPDDASREMRYWAAGFVAGSTPDPDDADELSADELAAWRTKVERYLESGSWPPG